MNRHSFLAAALLIVIATSVGCSDEYLYKRKLKRGAVYDPEYTAHLAANIEYSYQQPGHADLGELREALAFDTYLRSRDHLSEIELILDMIGYVHELVLWDGSAAWPEGSLNTLNILAHAEENQQGVNCRMKAVILQELYLAAGFPARMVSCIPLDKEDSDSHVIVSVWSQQLGKWIWADPSFNAYVRDEQGKLMSIAQVREGLIRGESFCLNEDAVLMDKPLESSFYFDYYMMKNLYVFITPMRAAYDYEGSQGSRYSIMLVPQNELPENKADLQQEYRFRDSVFTRYVISDPSLFWAAPEVQDT
ncbi:MAG: transglutaminase domain-containing protein [Spirochaetota bacterium]